MDIQKAIHETAQRHNLDPLLVEAIVIVESARDPWAVRYEPGWGYYCKPDYFCKRVSPPCTLETERVMQATSWGLMQIMGAVARELGFKGALTQLVDPLLNLELGCRHFLRLKRAGYTVHDNIAAYNAGSARKMDSGKYINQSYVDKVVWEWTRLKVRN